MKKFLAILLLLSMCCGLFAACTGGEDTTTATLDDAVEYLTSTYKADEGKKTPANYKLIAQVPVGDVTFNVTWTVDNEAIKIELVNGLYEVTVPTKNDTEVTYTLTATIKDAEGNTVTKTFTRILPVYDTSAAKTELTEGTAYKMYMVQANVGKTLFLTHETQKNKFIKTTVDPVAAPDFYAEIVDGGYKFYTTIDGVKNYVHASTTMADDGKVSKYLAYATESNCVYTYKAETKAWFVTIDNIEYVIGTYDSYETACLSEGTYMTAATTGVTQFPLSFMEKAAAEALKPSEGPADPTELTEITKIIELGNKLENSAQTAEKYLVTGKIVEIKNTEYGNIYIEDEAGNKLYVYGLYSKDGETRFDAMDPQPKVDDTVVIMGVISKYNDEAQLKNAWVQSINGVDYVPTDKPGDDTPSQPTGTPVIPEAGTAYKMSFVQVNKNNTTYYLTGVLSGYYMATSESAADGADFYIEAVEGGYNLYCMVDGAKKYVNVVKSDDGAHTNAKYEDAATTVWTIDETLKTVVATISDGSYILGTRADGTYTTLGPMKSDSGCMYAQFVIPGTTDSGDNGDTTNPGTSTEGVTEVKVETAYKLSGENKNGAIYFNGSLDNGRIDGTTDVASATVVMLEAGAADGEYYIYFMNGDAKTYIAVNTSASTKTAAFVLSTEKNDNAVWLIDHTAKTIISKAFSGRGIATRTGNDYTTFSTYASSNFGTDDYVTSWFVAA